MQHPQLTLNCDLGEGLDAIDAKIMPHIDFANIACGGHAGDITSMTQALLLANHHDVKVGAHPSYPDRENFGRKRLSLSSDALRNSLQEQITHLSSIAARFNIPLHYIKPHGALYNDCIKPDILETLISLSLKTQLPLMLLAGNTLISDACKQAGVTFIREAFADRQYSDEGLLVARTQPNALLSSGDSLRQVQQLKFGKVTTSGGLTRPLECDSLCIHSDTAGAVETAKQIRLALRNGA